LLASIKLMTRRSNSRLGIGKMIEVEGALSPLRFQTGEGTMMKAGCEAHTADARYWFAFITATERCAPGAPFVAE